jgi:hypothetical protein
MPSGVDEPGDVLDQLVRDVEQGRIRNQRSPPAVGVLSEITTRTTGTWPRHHRADLPVSLLRPQDERGSGMFSQRNGLREAA